MGSQGKLRSSVAEEHKGMVVDPASSLTLESHSVLNRDQHDVLVAREFREHASGDHLAHYGHFLRGKVRLFGHFVPMEILALGLVETILFFLASLAAIVALSGQPFTLHEIAIPSLALQGATVASMLTVSLGAVGLYSAHQRADWTGLLARAAMGAAVAVVGLSVGYALLPGLAVDTSQIVAGVLASIAVLGLTRPLYYRYVDGALLIRRVLVLGAGERAQSIERLRRRSDQRGFQVVGFIAPRKNGEVLVDPSKVLDTGSAFCSYAIEHDVDEIVVALDDRRQGAVPTKELLNCRLSGLDVVDIQDFFERETGKIRLDLLQPGWLIHAEGFKRHVLRDFWKRIFDVSVSLLLLLLTLPFTLVTALAILIESRGKGSVFYRQRRVGQGGKVFELIKFRSMRMDAEADGKAKWASADDPRITRVGRIIRKARIDELPQLWNVLRNEMSIVGPRPERPEFIARLNGVNPLYKERHRVKPGIAGWAQLRYPYGASEKDAIEKLQYDLYYVKNHRVLFDLYILIQTVEVVLLGKGAR